MPTQAGADAAPLKKDDLVLLDYELWAEGAERNELIDTSREEIAQKSGRTIPQGTTFGPRPHLVGGDAFPDAIEAAIVGAKVGEPIDRLFKPAEAFGERDPKLIELFSMHEISRLPEMRREDAELNVGTVLTIKGRRGRVTTVTAARVRVDFNPPFAGRKVHATMTPVSRIDDPAERGRALVDLTYGHAKEFDVKLHQGVLSVHVPERAKFDLGWLVNKPRFIEQVRAHLKPKSIHIIEEYATPVPKEEPEASKPKAPTAASETSAKPTHSHETERAHETP